MTGQSHRRIFDSAAAAGLIGEDDTSVIFYDLSMLKRHLLELASAFPPNTLHACAVKANPLAEVQATINALGAGAEVASPGELELAQRIGFPSHQIVYDSPAKTVNDLRRALQLGVNINANSIDELDRIAAILNEHRADPRGLVGARVNPSLGQGKIDHTSTAVPGSKFGISLHHERTELIERMSRYSWLNGIHVHIGSQGMSLEQLVEGIGQSFDFLVEDGMSRGIRAFNLGGGLPVRYRPTDPVHTFQDYWNEIEARCVGISELGLSLGTEFGRALHAQCGWVATRVEYVLRHGGTGSPTAIVHVGADMFLRTAYRPDAWHHELTALSGDGRLLAEDTSAFHIAGPLCFSGDYISSSAVLPVDLQSGDFVLIHDAGAYTFSMWSAYNSRQFPAVLGYHEAEQGDDWSTPPRFEILKERQSTRDAADMWSR